MNSARNGRTSTPRGNQIFFWALTGDYSALREALEGGMSVNVIDPVTTDSPLMIACRKGHTDIVRLCLEYGAKNDPHPEFGQTALHASVAEQKYESAKILLEVAAASDADHIISNLSDPSGQTPLHTAAYIGSTSLVELLLQHGAELSSVDAQGQTALHLCASTGVKICLAMILDHGGDELIDLQDHGGNTALHHATFHGRMDCVRLLLETAADVSIRNYEGYTAYNIASAQGHHQIGLLLFEYRDLHAGSKAPSVANSNLPTPSKARGSQAATPLHYQTPQSSAKYGAQGGEYPYSPSMHLHDFAEDHSDSPERQVKLNIRPAPVSRQPSASHHPPQHGTGLGLHAPSNPLSSMFGAVGGMENLDSIGSFLPRPHTVNSPSVGKGGLHAAALRGQHSSRGSPGAVTNNYNNANPMRRSAEDPLGGSGLTQGSVAAHNHRNNGKSVAIGSPMSPNSEPGSLEGGTGNNGYKVLVKQSQLGFVPPSLSRQSSESVGSKQSSGSDPMAKMQLFDGIQTYTKSSIIPTQDPRLRRHSADSPSQFPGSDSGAHVRSYSYGGAEDGPAEAWRGPGHLPPSAGYGGGIPTSHSSSAIDNMPYNHTQHGLRGGSQYPTAHSYNNFLDHHMESIAHTNGHKANPSQSTVAPLADIPGPPQSTPQKSRSNAGAISMHDAHGHQSAFDYQPAEYSTEVAAESTDFAEPIEEFTHLGRDWKVYYTEEQHIYYLDMANEHSQWEDPREWGIRYFSEVTESPAGRTSEPPKSPSPKAMEKVRSFHFNSHHADASEEESPRVRDIKPIRLNWDGGAETGAQDATRGRGNKTRNGDEKKKKQVQEFSSDSSDDEVTSAVKVRYHTRPTKSGEGAVLMADGTAVGSESATVATTPEPVAEEVLDLEHIAVSGEKLAPPARSEEPERANAVPLFQRSDSGAAFESAEQLEKGRIRLLASQYEKPGGKPLSPAGAHLVHTASFTRGSSEGQPAAEDSLKKAPDSPAAATVRKQSAESTQAPAAAPPAATAQATQVISREEAEEYVQAIVSGRSVQEVSDVMDKHGRTQAFKLQVLAWADEALLLAPAAASFTSPVAVKAPQDSSAAEPAPAPAAETVQSLKEDAVLGKYAKMLGMGVPPPNVLMKMKMEGVEVPQRNRLMRAAGHDLEPDPSAAVAGGVAGGAPVAPLTRRPSANMQNLHWNTLPAERLKNSIWAQTAGTGAADIAETDLQELERLFGAQKSTGSFATTRNVGALADSAKETLQLKHLDRKRAQNIVIGLNPFKGLGSHVELLKALCSLNDLNGKITSDSIDNFRTLLPTEAEMKRIDKVKGSKHPAEVFFQAVMLFYPELPMRLTCFSACLNFPGNCEALLGRTRKIINACNQVLASNNLARLLQRMLVVGNIMNEGTRRGGASGFTLDSLIKMVNTKGVDKKTSVLDYVVKSLYDKQEESVLAVIDDLSLVEETARLSGTEVMKEFDTVRASLDGLEDAYRFNQKKTDEPGFASPTAKKMIDEFSTKLESYLGLFQGQMQECERSKIILKKKIDDIIRYFGEDIASCDTTKIFGTLHEFLRAVAFSKAAVEWRLYRSQTS